MVSQHNNQNSTPTLQKVKVWDISVRAFHWLMIALLGALWWSADAGEMTLHQIFAYGLMVLLVFRVLWGFIGSDTARFAQFVRSPQQVFQYARSANKSVSLGHNPMGGYMVIALLTLLFIQLVSGLFATDDIFTEGPLYSYVASSTASTLTWLHKQNFNVILGFAAFHVLAVLAYWIKGENLIKAMFTGYKWVSEPVSRPKFKPFWWAVILLVVLFTIVWFVVLAALVKYQFS